MKQKMKTHDYFMNQALKQARKAYENDEVPVGAVVVDKHGVIIARAYNQVEKKQSQTAHAELLAMQKATKKLQNWRLSDCWLYVTLEPCGMCFALACLSRVKGIIFGADSPLFGYRLDNKDAGRLYKIGTCEIEVIPGVQASQAAGLLKDFFKKKRKKGRNEAHRKNKGPSSRKKTRTRK